MILAGSERGRSEPIGVVPGLETIARSVPEVSELSEGGGNHIVTMLTAGASVSDLFLSPGLRAVGPGRPLQASDALARRHVEAECGKGLFPG